MKFLIIAILLIPFTVVKIGGIKVYELFYLFLLGKVLLEIIRDNKLRIYRGDYFDKFSKALLLFLYFTLLVSVINFNQDFYPPSNVTGIMNKPIFITISRFIELILCIFLMWLLYTKINTIKEYRIILKTYLIIGLIACLYGLVSYVLNRFLGLSWYGTYSENFRLRGTFVEGGPFGVYICSLIVVAFHYFKLFTTRISKRAIVYVVLIISMVLTVSKAAFLLLCLLICFAYLFSISKISWKQIILLGCFFIIACFQYSNVLNGLNGYINTYKSVSDLVSMHSTDGNMVYGRIAAAHIIPKMVESNPLAGIGLGNYPIVRNNPDYRGFFPENTLWDLSGLGIFEAVAELGLPLTIYLMIILFSPLIILKRKNIKLIPLTLLVVFQIASHLFGVQLTFVYPWVITAFLFLYFKLYGQTTDKGKI